MDMIAAFDESLEFAKLRGMHQMHLAKDCSYQHLVDMRERMSPEMNDGKLGRWLGWAQACMFCAGVGTLDDFKAINQSHSKEDNSLSLDGFFRNEGQVLAKGLPAMSYTQLALTYLRRHLRMLGRKFHPTHQHADGGLYEMGRLVNIKHPDTGEWLEGIMYYSGDGDRNVTTLARWHERFTWAPTPLPMAMLKRSIQNDLNERTTHVTLPADVVQQLLDNLK